MASSERSSTSRWDCPDPRPSYWMNRTCSPSRAKARCRTGIRHSAAVLLNGIPGMSTTTGPPAGPETRVRVSSPSRRTFAGSPASIGSMSPLSPAGRPAGAARPAAWRRRATPSNRLVRRGSTRRPPTPAPWPLTVQHIMFRVEAWEILSPPIDRPATIRLRRPESRHQRAVRDLEVAPGRRQDEHAVAVDELGKDPDRVLEPGLLADVVGRQVVDGPRSCACRGSRSSSRSSAASRPRSRA